VKGYAGQLILWPSSGFVDGVASSQFKLIQSLNENKLISTQGKFSSGEKIMDCYTIDLIH
jgi:hypothetical protein